MQKKIRKIPQRAPKIAFNFIVTGNPGTYNVFVVRSCCFLFFLILYLIQWKIILTFNFDNNDNITLQM